MKNETKKIDHKLAGFIGFIPKSLKIADNPELQMFSLNVLIGRYTIKDGKQTLGSVLYEPDLSNLEIDKNNNMILIYRSRYDKRYYLKMSIDKEALKRKCEKYKENSLLGEAEGPIYPDKLEESWNNFFKQVAFLGLDNGEICNFS